METTENKVTLTISTINKDVTDDFPVNQPLHALKKSVMAKVKMDPSQADQFVLVLNGTTLDESKTLADLDIPEESIIVLERKEVVKI